MTPEGGIKFPGGLMGEPTESRINSRSYARTSDMTRFRNSGGFLATALKSITDTTPLPIRSGEGPIVQCIETKSPEPE